MAGCAVKFFDGGWVTLVLGGLLLLAMTTWARGRSRLLGALQQDGLALEPFIASLADSPLPRAQRTAVYPVADGSLVPQALLHNLKHNQVLHVRNLVLTVVFEERPWVPVAERVVVEPLDAGFWRVQLHFGFMDEPDVPRALATGDWAPLLGDPMQASWFLSRATVLPGRRPGMAAWRQRLFAGMARGAQQCGAQLPPARQRGGGAGHAGAAVGSGRRLGPVNCHAAGLGRWTVTPPAWAGGLSRRRLGPVDCHAAGLGRRMRISPSCATLATSVPSRRHRLQRGRSRGRRSRRANRSGTAASRRSGRSRWNHMAWSRLTPLHVALLASSVHAGAWPRSSGSSRWHRPAAPGAAAGSSGSGMRGAHPVQGLGRHRHRVEGVDRVHRAHVHRLRLPQVLLAPGRHAVDQAVGVTQVVVLLETLGRRRGGHAVLVGRAVLALLERRRHVEDRLAMLDGHHAPGR